MSDQQMKQVIQTLMRNVVEKQRTIERLQSIADGSVARIQQLQRELANIRRSSTICKKCNMFT